LVNQKRQLTLLNRELETVNRKVKHANESLEQLNYTISHDLKEPIRTISGMSQLVQKHFGDSIPEKAAKYLQIMNEASAKAQRMINDLMVFFKETQTGSSRPVSIVELLNQVQSVLSYLIEERDVRIEIKTESSVLLPAVFSQVFQNLLLNAIKYTPNDRTPHITITAITESNAPLCKIKDNGIGIDDSQKKKLFTLFQRLENNLKTDGSGIGLTIVKKIVESFGGTIWVESAPGEGSTFIFQIPYPI
jgi:signal transduction histidine kinase